MSAVEATASPTRSRFARISPATKAAVIAYLGSGKTQAQAAQHFGIHPNSVYNLWKIVKQDQHPENPANKDWKNDVLPKAQKSIETGIAYAGDPIGAMNGAIKLLHGTGYLTTTNKNEWTGNVNITFAWGAPQPAEHPMLDDDVIDVTPSDESKIPT